MFIPNGIIQISKQPKEAQSFGESFQSDATLIASLSALPEPKLVIEKEVKANDNHPRIMIVDDVFFNIDILKNVLKKVLKVNVKTEMIEAFNGK